MRITRTLCGRLLAVVAVAAGAAGMSVVGCARQTPAQQAPLAKAAEQAKPAGYIPFHEKTLANGLRVIVSEDKSAPVAAVYVWYHVGSKDENPERQGFAHMFEHMMFFGTDVVGPKDHTDKLREIGADNNAYTWFDNTVYHQTVPANQLDLALWLEAERMAFLKIDQSAFSTERAVVEEERRQRLNAPYGSVFERAMAGIYKQHPYRWTPIGLIPHLRKASVDELARFWELYYNPNNAALVIVGDVDAKETIAKVEKMFGWIPKGPDAPRVTVREPAIASPIELKMVEPKGPLTVAAIGYRAIPKSHPDAVALEMAASILGGGESSRANVAIVKEAELSVGVGAEALLLEQDGLVGIGGAVAPGKSKDEMLKALREQVRKIRDEGVTSEELEKARTQMMSALVRDSETVDNKADLLGEYAVIYGNTALINERYAKVAAVTAADVQRVAQTYFRDEGEISLVVEPSVGDLLKSLVTPKKSEEDEVPVPKVEGNPTPERLGSKAGLKRPANWPTTAPMGPLLQKYTPPATVEKRLENGMRVVVLPNSELPVVNLSLGLLNGAYTETGKYGAAAMAGEMITQGTENYDSDKLAEELDRYAVSLSAGVGMDSGVVSASSLTSESERAMRLMAEVVRRPTFPQEDFTRVQQQKVSGLTVSLQDAKYLADRELRRQVWGSAHPYGRNAGGDLDDVKALTREDLANWWKSQVRPDRVVLYVAGDVTADSAVALANRYFGDWKVDGEAPAAVVPAASARNGLKIVLVDKNVVQVEVRFSKLAINRASGDWNIARVVNQVFGGSFSSRLNDVLRVQKGLTYGIGGGFRAERFAGAINISSFTKPETTGEMVKTVLEEVRRMGSGDLTEAELNAAKNYMVASFAGDRETLGAQVSDLWLAEVEGLPKTFFADALPAVAAASKDDVLRVSRKYLLADDMVVVVVGNAKALLPQLSPLGPVTVVNTKGEVQAAGQ